MSTSIHLDQQNLIKYRTHLYTSFLVFTDTQGTIPFYPTPNGYVLTPRVTGSSYINATYSGTLVVGFLVYINLVNPVASVSGLTGLRGAANKLTTSTFQLLDAMRK